MKRRYLYSILVGVPGFVDALIVSFLLFGFAVGFLWVFVFGDNPWPAYLDKVLPVVFVLVFLVIWLATMLIGYAIGKRLEQEPKLNKAHVWISVGITVLSVLLIVFFQISNGNLGPKSDEARCSDFCSQKGFQASEVSPRALPQRTCGCLNGSGQQVIQVPVESLGQ